MTKVPKYFVYIICTIVYVTMIISFINLFSFGYHLITGQLKWNIDNVPSLAQVIIIILSFYAAYGVLSIFRKINQSKQEKKNGTEETR